MEKFVKSCLQLSLKIANLTIGTVGIAMLIYGLWMIRVWQRDAVEDSPSSPDYTNFPWFIHAFLGIGIAMCAITCLGHIAANSANSYCLSFYTFIIFVLLLLEIGMAADIFLNSHWEKDLPDDPSGRFDDFEHFVKSNTDICQWIALLVVLAQGCSILFATILRTVGKLKEYNHDHEIIEDEYVEPRVPLLRNIGQPTSSLYPYVMGEPHYAYYKSTV